MKYLTGERAMVNIPVKLKSAEKKKYARGPFLGEHSEKIIKGLGYTEEQMKDLHARNVFNTRDDLREKFGGNLKDEKSY